MYTFGKNRLKFGKDFTDFAPDVEQIVRQEGSFRASERYRDGDIAVHVHLRIRPSIGEENTTEYCAIFSKRGIVERNGSNLGISRFIQAWEESNPLRQWEGDRRSGSDKDGCRMQKPVLISIIDPTEPREGMVDILIASEVWLTLLDQCPIALKQTSESLPRATIPFLAFIGDYKSGMDIYLIPSHDNQSGNYIVQNRSKFVRPLSNEDAPFEGWFTSQAKNILAALFIEVGPNAVVYGLEESADFVVELAEILICPLEPKTERLDSTIHERSMLYSNYGRRKNGNAKDSKRSRDTNTQTQGRVRRHRKGGETHQTSSSPPPPEEVEFQTAPSHRCGDYTAKHIHSGSLEDV